MIKMVKFSLLKSKQRPERVNQKTALTQIPLKICVKAA
jgi:hypothetical protein